MASHFKYHVFYCLNERENGKDSCIQRGAQDTFDYMKSKVKALKLSGAGKVRINRAGCLDRCKAGPVLVVYPDAIWYSVNNQADIDEIIESHLINDKPVNHLMVDPL